MKIILSLFFLSFAFTSQAQALFPEIYNECKADGFFLENQEINAKYNDEQLLKDILKTISPNDLKKIKGKILIQVFVDTLGNHCCVSIQNDLNTKGKKVDFNKIINNETNWTPPISKGQLRMVCAIVKIEFLDDKIVLTRNGFHAKKGMMVLSSFEMKR